MKSVCSWNFLVLSIKNYFDLDVVCERNLKLKWLNYLTCLHFYFLFLFYSATNFIVLYLFIYQHVICENLHLPTKYHHILDYITSKTRNTLAYE